MTGSKVEPPGPEVLFVPYSERSKRVKCTVCGASGWGPSTDMPLDVVTFGLATWQKKCRRGHLQCPDCGRWMKLKLDGSVMTHTLCLQKDESPAHP